MFVKPGVLWCLRQAADADAGEAQAQAQVFLVDPLVRPFVARAMPRAFGRARALTAIRGGAHETRVAFLLTRGVTIADPDDVAAVRERYSAEAARLGGGLPGRPATRITISLALACAVAAVMVLRSRPNDGPKPEATLPACQPAILELDLAERPSSAGVEAVFGESLTAYEVARGDALLARGARESRRARRSLAAARESLTGLPSALLLADDEVPSALGAVVAAAEGGRDMRQPVRSLNALLERKAVTAFLDVHADPVVGQVLFGFRRLRDVQWQRQGARLVVHHLREITRHNAFYVVHGLRRAGAAMLFPDQIYADLAVRVLPAFAPGGRLRLRMKDHGYEEVERQLGAALRAAFRGCSDRLERIGALAERRMSLLDRWERERRVALEDLVRPSDQWGPWGGRVRPAAREALAAALAKAGAAGAIDELDAIEAGLGEDDAAMVGGTIGDLLVASVERHELQHLVDARADETADAPAYLHPRGEAACLSLADGCRELGAYLAALADGPAQVSSAAISGLVRFVLDEQWNGYAQQLAALTILEGLWGRTVRREDGEVDRVEARSMVAALAAMPPLELRRRAAVLWTTLFTEPLERLQRTAGGSP